MTIDLATPRAVHVVGVGGSGMSPIATVLAAMGHRVSGSDVKESPVLDRLRALGVHVDIGQRAEHLRADVELLTRSTAVPDDNIEVAEALRRGIPVLRRADTLAGICALRRPIAIAGSHGKTTTSSMLALVLVEAGVHPSYIVGGELRQTGGNAVWSAAPSESDRGWFVVEADESDGTFLELGTEIAVVTSLEPDHLEYWGDWDGLRAGFDRFLAEASGVRVVCADDEGAAAVGAKNGALTYGTTTDADYRMTDLTGGRTGAGFTLVQRGQTLGRVELPVPGMHNARNAAAAMTVALEIGVDFADAAHALSRYTGVARRFQFRGEGGGVTFIDDYAHLPGEISSMLEATGDGDWDRVVCVFQPHRYSRMATLVTTDFAEVFDRADVLVLTEIYAQGEAPRPGVSGKRILEAVLDARPGRKAYWFPNRQALAANVKSILRPGDLCLTLGAGDLTLLPDEILATDER